MNSFSVVYRGPGHWDVLGKDSRIFRLRGGPSQWDVIDERSGKGQNSTVQSFKEQSAAMSYICAELMYEPLIVDGQDYTVMKNWNIDYISMLDLMGPTGSNQ